MRPSQERSRKGEEITSALILFQSVNYWENIFKVSDKQKKKLDVDREFIRVSMKMICEMMREWENALKITWCWSSVLFLRDWFLIAAYFIDLTIMHQHNKIN